MIPRHVIYCDHYPDGEEEAGSNAHERKPATVSHEIRKQNESHININLVSDIPISGRHLQLEVLVEGF